MWKVSKVESVLPGEGAFGFNITNDWGKPLVSFAYETRARKPKRLRRKFGWLWSGRLMCTPMVSGAVRGAR
jgi:hypothetical protein